MVNMVNKHIIRDFYYTAVYRKMTSFAIFIHNPTDGVETSVHFCGIPFVFGEPPVIIGINDGIFALGEGDSAEGVAVADVAISKYGENHYAFDTYRDGNDDVNNSPSMNDRSQKTEIR